MANPDHLDADIEDINDVLKKIEIAYGIRFGETELQDVRTFGQLCNCILDKVSIEDVQDCTTQQAFYKLRDAFVEITGTNREDIKVNTDLSELFLSQDRKKQVKELEAVLGFKTHILTMQPLIKQLTVSVGLLSGIVVFFNWQYGLSGAGLTIALGLWGFATANTFTVRTVGELSEKLVMEHYINVRRNPLTGNKDEIIRQIEKLFLEYLMIDRTGIHPDTIIVS